MFRYVLLPLLLLLATSQVFSQHTYLQTNRIPVQTDNGSPIINAWTGGMNTPQLSSIDLDMDGVKDLVAFDRSDQTFTTYRYNPTTQRYEYAPEFKYMFSDCDCNNWALLADYDCDGRADLYCGHEASYVKAYKNVLLGTDSMTFKLSYEYVFSNDTFWMYVPSSDVPAIVDVDHDGDLDILSFESFSNYLIWHKNYSMERYNRCDTLVYELGSGCWGHFYESNNNNTAFIHDTLFCSLGDFVPPHGNGGIRNPGEIDDPYSGAVRHAGSTTLALDLNGSGVYDVIIGDVSYNELYAVYNVGRPDYAYMDSVERNFPSLDVPINVTTFPATFYVDVDHDGNRDLLVAPNVSSAQGENVDGLVYYRNVGLDDSAVFQYQGRTLLTPDNLDLGSNSSPAFFDYEGDGDQDLLVGNWYAYYHDAGGDIYQDELHLYLNTGTATSPVFTLVDRNFLNVSAGTNPRFSGLSPAFGDLDGDGDEDMMLGNTFGEIFFYTNTAAQGQPASFQQTSIKFANIDVGNYAAPELYDFDGDNDLDLFIGNENGQVAYYRNEGTAQSANFTLVTTEFGFINLGDKYNSPNSGTTQPLLLDWNEDGQLDLLLGSERGYIEVFTNLLTGFTDTLRAVDTVLHTRFGAYASPTAAVLDTTGAPTLVIGLSRGGMLLVAPAIAPDTVTSILSARSTMAFRAFPNPVSESVTLEWDPGQEVADVRLVSIQGQVLRQARDRSGSLNWSTSDLPGGIYFVTLRAGERFAVVKLIKE